MRRPSGIFLACALMVLTASLASAQAPATQAPATTQSAQPAKPAGPPLNFTGDVVLWAFTINPDKTADYDQVIAKLKESLQKITRPEAKEQLAGWRVIKNAQPQPDGTILYILIINVVKNADYSINNIVYEAFTDFETQQKFYEMYRGAVKSAFFVIQGPLVADLSK
jgi:hypothetical protein